MQSGNLAKARLGVALEDRVLWRIRPIKDAVFELGRSFYLQSQLGVSMVDFIS